MMTGSPGFLLSRALVEFYCWLATTADPSTQGDERNASPSMQRDFMHLVERNIHDAGNQSLDHHAAPNYLAHQIADRVVTPQRHQRAAILVMPRTGGVTGYAVGKRPYTVGALL